MQNIEKAHEPKELDLTGAARGVWLVKVPKYLSEQWEKITTTSDVGKLKITKPKFEGGKPEVIFSLHDQVLNAKPESSTADSSKPKPKIPKDHKFVLTGISSQSLSVLSVNPNAEAAVSGGPIDFAAIDGKIIQRAECRPMADKNYMAMKKTHMELSNKPKRQVEQLERVVQTYKPISAHSFDVREAQKKKQEGKKARLDKDKVMDMLFNAFEKHQYYNVKDLERLTKQPMPYLKEILKEICIYNMKAPHKNMWELKPEYRHYKDQT